MLTVNYDYIIEKTKDEKDIIKINKDNKWIYIGSKYNSSREVEKFLGEIKNGFKDKRDVFVVYGFGTGSHIYELKKKYDNKIIVFEPNKKLIKYAKEQSWLREDKNIILLCCEDEELIFNIKKYINTFNFKNTEFITFSNYKQIYSKERKEFYSKINEYIVRLNLDLNTKLRFGKVWFENLIESIQFIVNGIPADCYDNKFKNIPAVIVSAGPSLEKNIDKLKYIKDNMLIISGGRTLSALIDKNIKVDLLVIADSTERNYTLVKDYMDKLKSPVLFSEGSNLKIIKEHKGSKIFYSYSDLIHKIVGRKMTHISTGGSVAHAMTSYMANLGCNPIIFIGQDFAYTNEMAHASMVENKDGSYNYSIAMRDDDIYVEDINGNLVRTSIVLNNQRLAMEQIIKLYPKIKFINATEGGARIKGTKEMKLEEALNLYCKKECHGFEKVGYNLDMKENAIKELYNIKNNGIKMCSIAKKQLEYVNELEKAIELNDNIAKNKLEESIALGYSEFIKIYEENNTFECLLYKLIYEYLKTDDELNKNNDKLGKEQGFYGNLIKLLDYAVNFIDNQITVLKKM